MASKVGIANIALRAIGSDRITSFSDNNKRAAVVSDIYDELRITLLTGPWAFAETRVELAVSATSPVFEFDKAYVLPADWLYTVSVHDNDAGVSSVFYKESHLADQKVLLADPENLFLRYTHDEEDPNIMSAEFRHALSMALARDMAIPLASSKTMFKLFTRRATRALARARSSDALGSFPERRPRGSWANARNGFRNRSVTGTSST